MIIGTFLIAIAAVLVADGGHALVTKARYQAWERSIERGSDGVRSGFEAFSLGAGETGVLFVHGFGDSPQGWRKVAPVVAEAGFAVRVMRLPGAAEPMERARQVSDEDWVAEVQRELDALSERHEEVWVVAHSMGGAISLRTLLPQQDRVAGLVLVAPLLEVSNRRSPVLSAEQWYKVGRSILPFTNSTESYFPPDVHGIPEEEVLRDPFLPLRTTENLFATVEAIRGRAPEWRKPLLLFVSSKDKVVDAESARAFVRDSGAQVRQSIDFRACGHVPMLDNGWEDMTQLMIEFMREPEPRPLRGELIEPKVP